MTRYQKQSFLVFLNVAGDIFAVLSSFAVAYGIRFFSGIFPPADPPDILMYARALGVVLPVFLWSFRAYRLYQASRSIRRIEEIFTVVKAITLAVVILMALTFFYRGFSYSRLFLTILWGTAILTVGLVRYYVIQWEYARKRRQRHLTKILIAGANRNARNIIKWARNNPHYGVQVLGVLAREPLLVSKHLEGVSVLGIIDQCENFMDHLKPDEVILLDSSFSRERITDLMLICEDKMIDFKLGADIYGLMTRNVDVRYLSTVPLLGFRDLPLDDPWNRFTKRAFDIAVSLALILLTAPVTLAVAILIKLDDRGPVFYGQERMGRNMKLFKVLKFRTMRPDAEKNTGPVWAKAADNRKTRIGKFLRRWNLDELPQFYNVLKGDMSLVGPRPERLHFVEKFREAIPRYMARHKIKSGLTGWAQVNGYRGNTSILERTKYDLYYMENWSLLFDIEILLMTFFAFKNAY